MVGAQYQQTSLNPWHQGREWKPATFQPLKTLELVSRREAARTYHNNPHFFQDGRRMVLVDRRNAPAQQLFGWLEKRKVCRTPGYASP